MQLTSKEKKVIQIPSTLLHIYETHQINLKQKQNAYNKKQRECLNLLYPLTRERQRTQRKLGKHYEKWTIIYGAHPICFKKRNRNAQELKTSIELRRAALLAHRAVHKKEREVLPKLYQTKEALGFKQARNNFEQWIANVCRHFHCKPTQIDWNAGMVVMGQLLH